MKHSEYAQIRSFNGNEEDSTRINSLITSNSQFAVCRVSELEVVRLYDGQYITNAPFEKTFQMLFDAGYIKSNHTYSELVAGNTFLPTYYRWTPNAKCLATLGSDIREWKEKRTLAGGMAYKWQLVLGCREFQQIDAVNKLADGVKVDFSWHWKTTAIGAGARLSDARQRGVVYFTRTSNGLIMDHIQFGSEDAH